MNAMGHMDGKGLDERDNKRARAKGKRESRRESGAGFETTTILQPHTLALVLATVECGGAVRLGKTRDGGALAVGMYMGDDYATEYIRPTEDMATACEEIARAWHPDGGERYLATLQWLSQPQKPTRGAKNAIPDS